MVFIFLYKLKALCCLKKISSIQIYFISSELIEWLIFINYLKKFKMLRNVVHNYFVNYSICIVFCVHDFWELYVINLSKSIVIYKNGLIQYYFQQGQTSSLNKFLIFLFDFNNICYSNQCNIIGSDLLSKSFNNYNLF